MIGLINGGVKIEITRVKEPQKPVSIANAGDIDSSTPADSEPPETTTLMTTSTFETTTITTTTATTTKIAIDSTVQRLTNSTPSSLSNTSELTTISQANATDPIKPAQTNTSNISSVLVNNVTLSYANDLVPFLSEFTRRQMRRKLIPEDYYCPCDLKVCLCNEHI